MNAEHVKEAATTGMVRTCIKAAAANMLHPHAVSWYKTKNGQNHERFESGLSTYANHDPATVVTSQLKVFTHD